MSENRLMTGSINVTRLLNELNAKNDSFFKRENGDIYVNIKLWLNKEPDQYKNDGSIQLNPKKDSQCEAKYIGNFRNVPKPSISENDIPQIDTNGIEVRATIQEIDNDDLPY